jgi:hypothetical protein
MIFTTKINLNSSKIEQCSNEVLNLSGCTQVYGQFSILNPTGFTSPFNAGTGKVWTSDAVGNGSWQASSGGTGSTGTITGGTNGLSTSGASIVLGGTLNASLTCLPTSVEFAGAGTKFLIGTGTCDPLANFLGGKLYIGRSCTECDSYAFIGSKTHASGGVVGSFIQTTSGAGICSWFCNGVVNRTTLLDVNGLIYGADYSACYTDRSLVDRAYVLSQVSSGATNGIGWSNLSNGSTVAGCGTIASGGTICQNTIYGVCAGRCITTGFNNVAIGLCALNLLTTGSYNIAIGERVMSSATGGTNNIAIGQNALNSNMCNGAENVAIGYCALYRNKTGVYNVALSTGALCCNTTGNGNIAIGYNSLLNNLTGINNIAFGYTALSRNTLGSYNIAIGCGAGFCNLSGDTNIAIGTYALFIASGGTNNIGIGNCVLCCGTSSSTNNVAIGNQALLNNRTGCQNIAFGNIPLYSNVIGSDNIAMGYRALYTNTGGTNNIAMGSQSLTNSICGHYNIALGCFSLKNNTIGWNNIAIGTAAICGNVNGNCNIGIGCESMSNRVNSGNTNTAIGIRALYNINGGCNNIAIGCNAGSSNRYGCNNVFIGDSAGYAETGSSKLYVANCGSCSLIYGEFDNKYLCLTSAFYVIATGSTCSNKLRLVEGNQGAGKILTSDANGYATWQDGSIASINTISGITYTIQVSDSGKFIEFTNTGDTTIICPTGLTIGFGVVLVNIGGGNKTITASTGATIYTLDSNVIIAGAYNAATMYYRAVGKWVGFGNLS